MVAFVVEIWLWYKSKELDVAAAIVVDFSICYWFLKLLHVITIPVFGGNLRNYLASAIQEL